MEGSSRPCSGVLMQEGPSPTPDDGKIVADVKSMYPDGASADWAKTWET